MKPHCYLVLVCALLLSAALRATVNPWATYFGSSISGTSVATDASGNIYVAGRAAAGGVATTGAWQTTPGGVIITKFSAAGILQWATFYGSGADEPAAIACDGYGNVVVAGTTASTSGIASTGAYQSTLAGSSDAFIVKFTGSGNRLWATYLGSMGKETAYGVACDAGGSIVLTGYTSSTWGIASAGAHQASYGGGVSDGFIAKFSAAGALSWSTYYGSADEDGCVSVCTDASGSILVTGDSYSLLGTPVTGISSTGAWQVSNAGNHDAFIVKLSESGGRIWASYFGGSSTDIPFGIAADSSGGITITGYTSSPSGIATAGAHQTTYADNNDGFIVRFTAQGNRLWGTYYGGTSFDFPYGIACEPNGTVVITGRTSSSSGIASAGSYQPALTGNNNAFVAKFNTWGARQWGTYFGNSNDAGYGVATNSDASVIVTGSTQSSSGIATPGAYQTALSGNYPNAFIASFAYDGGLAGIGNNTISSNQAICKSQAPATLSGSLPTGGNGTYAYTWLSSVSGPNTGYITVPDVGNTMHYAPPALLVKTWYKRVVQSMGRTDSSQAIVVSVNPLPKAGFSINKTQQCVTGNAFVFTDTSRISSGATARTWNLGGNLADTSSLVQAVKTFAVAGSYTIKLISISTYGCKDSTSQNVTLLSSPQAGFNINNPAQCVNQNQFILIDTSRVNNMGFTRLWNLGRGAADTVSNTGAVSMVLKQAGSLQVKLVVNTNGCKDSATRTITAHPSPAVAYSCPLTRQCLGTNSFQFSDVSTVSSGFILKRHWSFSDGDPATGTTLSRHFGIEGDIQVKLSVTTDNNCRDSVTGIITVLPQTATGFSIWNAKQCGINKYTFRDTSIFNGPPYAVSWKFGDGTTFSGAAVDKQFKQAGSFAVKLITTTTDGCTDSMQKIIAVEEPYTMPMPDFRFNSLYACMRNNAFVFDDATYTGNSTFAVQWDLGDGSTSANRHVSKTYTMPGVYQVKLVVTTAHNCIDSIVRPVNVYPQPVASFTVNEPIQCIRENNFVFSENARVPSGSYSRNWDAGDGSAPSNTAVLAHTYRTTGNFRVKLHITDVHFCTDSVINTISIKPSPVKPFVTILSNSELMCTPAYGYQWYYNGIPMPASNTQRLYINQNGDYKVRADSSNGCGSWSDVTFRMPDNHIIMVYPNPNKGLFSVDFNIIEGEKLMDVYDMKGAFITRFSTTNKVHTLDLRDVNAGLYMIRIHTPVSDSQEMVLIE